MITLHPSKIKERMIFMKLPNGYGMVTKLSGNRRKPYVVKEGISGKQKPIGYTTTREEGLILLAQYNNDPWDIQTDKITFQELYTTLQLLKKSNAQGTFRSIISLQTNPYERE